MPKNVAISMERTNQPIIFPAHRFIRVASPMLAKEDAIEKNTNTGTIITRSLVKIVPSGFNNTTCSPMTKERTIPTMTAPNKHSAKC